MVSVIEAFVIQNAEGDTFVSLVSQEFKSSKNTRLTNKLDHKSAIH